MSPGASRRTLRSTTEAHSTGSSGGPREARTRIVPFKWSRRPQCPSSGRSRRQIAACGTTRPKRWLELLSGSLAALPPLIRRFDGVDDPYVIERLAVVSHGAVLLWRPEGGGCCRGCCERSEARCLRCTTQIPNIITRDAVRGVHEWCFRHGLIDDREYETTLPPYGTDPPGKPRTEKQLDRVYGSRKYRRADVKWPYADVFMSIFMSWRLRPICHRIHDGRLQPPSTACRVQDFDRRCPDNNVG